jgi:hypothetical protein
MIPVAAALQKRGCRVIIGSGEEHLSLFRSELPGTECIRFEGFKPKYSGIVPQYLFLFLQIPLLVVRIFREHRLLNSIIRKFDIDIIISDNRFGLWNRKIRSVYITHQPRIPFPAPLKFLEFIGIFLHRSVMRRYSACFIPDLPGDINLSGRLSHNLKLPRNTGYMGILSRFSSLQPLPDLKATATHNSVILSGPEPQRSILKQKLMKQLASRSLPIIMLGGSPERSGLSEDINNGILYNHLPARGMMEVITGSLEIFSRPGYTTIMELVSLNRSGCLIPTPGQTEQEYLACYLSALGWFSSVKQGDIGKTDYQPVKRNFGLSERMISESRILFEKAIEIILDENQESSCQDKSKQIT